MYALIGSLEDFLYGRPNSNETTENVITAELTKLSRELD